MATVENRLARRARPLPDLWSRGTAWTRENWLLAGAIAAGVIARLVFWIVTDRRIDDSLITIKHAKNVADGVGLLHNLGDGHVHGFTSALSVLVPLPGEFLAADGGFFLIRAVSVVAFVVTAVYADRICRRLGLGRWATGFLLLFLALDQNQVFFGMAGMESQIAVAVLFVGIYYVLVEDFTKSGIALGLAPLARPDFILWVGPAYLFLVLRSRPRALRAALISVAVVAPWVIFTTIYYGSPVPNTIVAKSSVFGPALPGVSDVSGWINFLGDRLHDHRGDWRAIAPFYEKALVEKAPLPHGLLKLVAWVVLALAAVGVAANWRRRALWAAIAYVLLFIAYKFVFLTIAFFDWYGVPAAALIMLFAAAGLDRVAKWSAGVLRPRIGLRSAYFAAVPAVCLAIAYSVQLPFAIPIEARVQHDIEDRVRLPLGKYLGRVIPEGQSFTSESSGYVGYYTNGTLYDFPGLVSKTVLERFDEYGAKSWPETTSLFRARSPQLVIQLLRPDWLVLRPSEWMTLKNLFPEAAREYRPVRRFAVATGDVFFESGGLVVRNIDADFTVFRHGRPTNDNE